MHGGEPGSAAARGRGRGGEAPGGPCAPQTKAASPARTRRPAGCLSLQPASAGTGELWLCVPLGSGVQTGRGPGPPRGVGRPAGQGPRPSTQGPSGVTPGRDQAGAAQAGCGGCGRVGGVGAWGAAQGVPGSPHPAGRGLPDRPPGVTAERSAGRGASGRAGYGRCPRSDAPRGPHTPLAAAAHPARGSRPPPARRRPAVTSSAL